MVKLGQIVAYIFIEPHPSTHFEKYNPGFVLTPIRYLPTHLPSCFT